MTDPYTVLGVSPSATDDEIAKAYRAMARKYHPDLNPGDKSAEAKMKEVNAAYEEIQAQRSGKTSSSGAGGAYYGGGSPYGNGQNPYQNGQGYTGQNGYRTYYYTYRPGDRQNGGAEDPFNFFAQRGPRPGGIFRIPFVRILLIIMIVRLLINLLFSFANPYRYGYYYAPAYPYGGYSTSQGSTDADQG